MVSILFYWYDYVIQYKNMINNFLCSFNLDGMHSCSIHVTPQNWLWKTRHAISYDIAFIFFPQGQGIVWKYSKREINVSHTWPLRNASKIKEIHFLWVASKIITTYLLFFLSFQQKKISMAEVLLLIKRLRFLNFSSVLLWLQKTQILNTLG